MSQDLPPPANNVVDLYPDVITAEDRRLARKRAKGRALQVVEQREHLRLHIKTMWHMEEIYNILETDWSDPLGLHPRDPRRMDPVYIEQHSTPRKSRVGEFKSKLDAHFRMLNKVIPDLRSYEVDTTVKQEEENEVPKVQIIAFRDPNNHMVIKEVDPMGGKEVTKPIEHDDIADWIS